jgi:hypothetical protein
MRYLEKAAGNLAKELGATTTCPTHPGQTLRGDQGFIRRAYDAGAARCREGILPYSEPQFREALQRTLKLAHTVCPACAVARSASPGGPADGAVKQP